MADRKTYKAWGETVHVKINTNKKNSAQAKEQNGTKIFNRYCEGRLCLDKKRGDRNIVNRKGQECHGCYTHDLTGHLPKITYFDSQVMARVAL